MKMIKVAINGFGRIGRLAFRQMITSTDYDIVAINNKDLTADEAAYLIKYDTVHNTFHENEITFDGNELVIAGVKRVKLFSELDPTKLPWKELEVDLVLECTGAFTNYEGAYKHILAGAKKVLISAPGKDEMPTIVSGVNENILKPTDIIVSAASCTTNCLAPLLKIIEDNFGIEKGFMSTIHALTADQNSLDNFHKKGINSRRGRASIQNIVPTSTGAAKAIGLVIPSLNGKMDGIAYRVPCIDGSMIDVTLELKRNTSKEEINEVIKKNQSSALIYTEAPLVSSDVIGKKCGCLFDSLLTNVIEVDGKQLVKLTAWYDNEYGYTAQMLRTAVNMFKGVDK
ncbi:MAG: type I glyceraldehyde-3-phosphate dehydrogenase [bacterium]|nr:type I glyceraldehyde-3-phosphate dehydrogenase [bacterium]